MIIFGDCIEVLRTMSANSADAIITDPPYHLTTGKKGGTGIASLNPDSPAGRARIGTGFMGKKWDGGDIAFRPETWAEALRVAKPGAYLLAFGGTRTFHRLAVAIEDGGWEIRDTLAWVFGSGFPKSHNGEWGGTALKPAFEPIIMARKPLIGTVEANWRAYGTGALNIDACRIEGAKPATTRGAGGSNGRYSPIAAQGRIEDDGLGRWPANLIHDGSAEVLAAFPDAPGQMADASSDSSDRKTQNVYGAMKRGNGRDGEDSADSENAGSVGFKMRPGERRIDSGSAARFFYCAKASRAERNAGCEGLTAKTSGMVSNTSGQHITRRDGGAPAPAPNNHPTVKPVALMRYLCRLVTPVGGTVVDLFAGSGTTGVACAEEGLQFIGIDNEPDYVEIARAREKAAQPGLAI